MGIHDEDSKAVTDVLCHKHMDYVVAFSTSTIMRHSLFKFTSMMTHELTQSRYQLA
jgi:hypothetical protein